MTSATPQHPVTDRLEKVVTAMVVSAAALFVFWQLQPNLILSDTTPTGGDMGAHVWGPAFLRDELLPQLRLTGWTPDWYSGFPAFHFYMVLPALAIVVLDIGLNPFISLPIVSALLAAAIFFRVQGSTKLSNRLLIAFAVLTPFLVPIPYNIAFKLVAVSGVVLFPVAAWALGHFGGLRFPGPAVLSLSSLAFAFDRSFNIYGGNIASTLAGEFAASISLSFSLVALGLVIRGTRTGEYKGWAAAMIALTALCHLLPAFFLLGAVVVLMVLRVLQRRFSSVMWMMLSGSIALCLSAFWVLPFFVRTAYLNDMGWERIEIIHSPLVTRSNLNPANILSDYPPLPVLLIFAGIGLILSLIRRVELGWLLAFTAGLMAAGFLWFPDGRLWNARILPFYYLCVALLAGVGVFLLIVELAKTPGVLRLGIGAAAAILLLPTQIQDAVVWPEPGNGFSAYLGPAAGYSTRVICILLLVIIVGLELPRQLGRLLNRLDVVAVMAAIGLLIASPARDFDFSGLGTARGIAWGLVMLVSFVVLTAGAVKFLTLAFEGVTTTTKPEIEGREVAETATTPRFRAPSARTALIAAPIVAATSMFILLGLALNSIGGVNNDSGTRTWTLGPLPISSNDNSFIPGWSMWNFSGLEGKGETINGPGDVGQGGWEEYSFVQRTMVGVGQQVGCGRAMWEFAPELNRYGTTMAMMLMPMWTDGCIGSMEGLYFEATPTVPYHFMLQSDLSAPSRQVGTDQTVGGPSRAMRDLPYQDFDIDRGVDRMLELGVRYYMAFSPQSVDAARQHDGLREVTSAAPWVIFETQAALVEALDTTPVVIDGVRDHQDEWLDVGIEWFDDVSNTRPASSGPADWPHLEAEAVVARYEAEGTRLAGSVGAEDPLLVDLLPDTEVAEETTVTNIATDTDRISFSVDQIGTPVLIRTSYFPSWQADGADGPFRVAPNFMVVVPTEQNVELSFARTGVDWLAILLTLAGISALFAFGAAARRSPATATLAPDATFGGGGQVGDAADDIDTNTNTSSDINSDIDLDGDEAAPGDEAIPAVLGGDAPGVDYA